MSRIISVDVKYNSVSEGLPERFRADWKARRVERREDASPRSAAVGRIQTNSGIGTVTPGVSFVLAQAAGNGTAEHAEHAKRVECTRWGRLLSENHRRLR